MIIQQSLNTNKLGTPILKSENFKTEIQREKQVGSKTKDKVSKLPSYFIFPPSAPTNAKSNTNKILTSNNKQTSCSSCPTSSKKNLLRYAETSYNHHHHYLKGHKFKIFNASDETMKKSISVKDLYYENVNELKAIFHQKLSVNSSSGTKFQYQKYLIEIKELTYNMCTLRGLASNERERIPVEEPFSVLCGFIAFLMMLEILYFESLFVSYMTSV